MKSAKDRVGIVRQI